MNYTDENTDELQSEIILRNSSKNVKEKKN